MRATVAALAILLMPAASTYGQTSTLESSIERYQRDLGALDRALPVNISDARAKRMAMLYADELSALEKLDFEKLNDEGKVDWILFRNELRRNLRQLEIDAEYRAKTSPLLPFADEIIGLEEARRRFDFLDAAKTADKLNNLARSVRDFHSKTEAKPPKIDKTIANRAVQTMGQIKRHLDDWHTFYNGYDPMYSWWCAEPYKALVAALDGYQGFVREKLVGIRPDDKTTIIGFPIGNEALLAELEFEMIPYTPDELVQIANKEFAWCEAEMKKASREMGFGDDWKKALEKVKRDHVEPGKQPELIRELALEAIKFVEEKNLVTVPPLAKETWRMDMLTPEQQLQSPFFLGGEEILVSFPTSGMAHEAKLMSLRGNNKHFSRATVQHELIPGHHLQQFMTSRYNTHRGLFGTPFWTEGWALYWEFLLYELGFPKSPENKVGMLFWRMHRCARIIFSLSFHLGKMTPQECVDFLVDRVGHERDNASAEVRRSFAGNYGPLYQAAYMLGGLQFWAMHRDLVGGKKMTDRQFHDTILQGGTMTVEMVRARLTKEKLTRDWKSGWRFYAK